MFDVSALGQREPPAWRIRTPEEYNRCCEQCELVIDTSTMSKKQWLQLRDSLSFDVRYEGHQGLCMTGPMSSLGLKPGDRLEPTMAMQDVAGNL